MSQAVDGWEVVRKDPGMQADPKLTVYANGDGYLNVAADRELLDRPEALRILIDRDTGRVALQPASSDDPNAYALVRTDSEFGGDISITSALHRLGVDVDGLEQSHFFSLSLEDGPSGQVAVADLADLLDDSESSSEPETPTDPEKQSSEDSEKESEAADGDYGQIWCGICGAGPFDSTQKLTGHHAGSNHDGDTLPASEPPAETGDPEDTGDAAVPDPDDSLSVATIEDCARSCETVQELADLLDVDVGKARFHARRADVYSDLQDLRDRPGVDR